MSFVSETAKRNPRRMMSCWKDNWNEWNILIYHIKKFIFVLSISMLTDWLEMEWHIHPSHYKL